MALKDVKDAVAGDFVLCESVLTDYLVGGVWKVREVQRTKLILVYPGEDQTGRKKGVGDKVAFMKSVKLCFSDLAEAEAVHAMAKETNGVVVQENKARVKACHQAILDYAKSFGENQKDLART